MCKLAALSLACMMISAPAFAQMASSISVPFSKGSNKFRPNEEAVSWLMDTRDAALITIRGRTSTTKATPHDEALALARALAARAYLIRFGVNPQKINVNFVSGEDFIADNSTQEGRAQNQRVDIEAVFVP